MPDGYYSKNTVNAVNKVNSVKNLHCVYYVHKKDFSIDKQFTKPENKTRILFYRRNI